MWCRRAMPCVAVARCAVLDSGQGAIVAQTWFAGSRSGGRLCMRLTEQEDWQAQPQHTGKHGSGLERAG